nr:shootin-1-like [Aegilops tauschii subsp. strangulata]
MDEGNTNITKMLEALLAKIDDQKAVHEKQIKLQAAFNAQISQEVRGLSRQIDLTQADLDLMRKTVEGSASPTGSVTTHLHQPVHPQQQPPPPPPPPPSPRPVPDPARSSSSHARLGDHRPPLLPVPPQGGFVAAATTSSTGYHTNEYHKPPKHDFPKSDGTTP